jgi:IS5 family transposase
LNKILLEKARDQKIIKGKKLRLDTTVIEANIHHPTDSSLIRDGIRVVTRIIKKIAAVNEDAAEGFRDRSRSARKTMLSILKFAGRRTDEAKEEVKDAVKHLVDIGKKVVSDANNVLLRLKNPIESQVEAVSENIGKAKERVLDKLKSATDILDKVITQTIQVLSGTTHIKNRIVSVFDPEARPISKGKISKPTEFGYKVQIEEAAGSLVTGYDVFVGNPGDSTLLNDAVERHEAIFHAPPKELAADRVYADRNQERALKDAGVYRIAIPYKGSKSQERRAEEHKPYFKRLQRWRAGGEAKISLLKRKYGLDRSIYRGFDGTQCWVAEGILTHNLRMMARQMG